MAEMRMPLGGHDARIGGLRIAERPLAVVSIAVMRGADAAFERALAEAYGAARPEPGRFTEGEGRMLLWSAPEQMLMVWEDGHPDASRTVRAALGDASYVTLQTDAFACIEVTGPAIPALERICPLDLARMEPGHGARTMMEHMGAYVLRTRAGWLLMSASSSARSFLHAVEVSARNAA